MPQDNLAKTPLEVQGNYFSQTSPETMDGQIRRGDANRWIDSIKKCLAEKQFLENFPEKMEVENSVESLSKSGKSSSSTESINLLDMELFTTAPKDEDKKDAVGNLEQILEVHLKPFGRWAADSFGKGFQKLFCLEEGATEKLARRKQKLMCRQGIHFLENCEGFEDFIYLAKKTQAFDAPQNTSEIDQKIFLMPCNSSELEGSNSNIGRSVQGILPLQAVLPTDGGRNCHHSLGPHSCRNEERHVDGTYQLSKCKPFVRLCAVAKARHFSGFLEEVNPEVCTYNHRIDLGEDVPQDENLGQHITTDPFDPISLKTVLSELKPVVSPPTFTPSHFQTLFSLLFQKSAAEKSILLIVGCCHLAAQAYRCLGQPPPEACHSDLVMLPHIVETGALPPRQNRVLGAKHPFESFQDLALDSEATRNLGLPEKFLGGRGEGFEYSKVQLRTKWAIQEKEWKTNVARRQTDINKLTGPFLETTASTPDKTFDPNFQDKSPSPSELTSEPFGSGWKHQAERIQRLGAIFRKMAIRQRLIRHPQQLRKLRNRPAKGTSRFARPMTVEIW